MPTRDSARTSFSDLGKNAAACGETVPQYDGTSLGNVLPPAPEGRALRKGSSPSLPQERFSREGPGVATPGNYGGENLTQVMDLLALPKRCGHVGRPACVAEGAVQPTIYEVNNNMEVSLTLGTSVETPAFSVRRLVRRRIAQSRGDLGGPSGVCGSASLRSASPNPGGALGSHVEESILVVFDVRGGSEWRGHGGDDESSADKTASTPYLGCDIFSQNSEATPPSHNSLPQRSAIEEVLWRYVSAPTLAFPQSRDARESETGMTAALLSQAVHLDWKSDSPKCSWLTQQLEAARISRRSRPGRSLSILRIGLLNSSSLRRKRKSVGIDALDVAPDSSMQMARDILCSARSSCAGRAHFWFDFTGVLSSGPGPPDARVERNMPIHQALRASLLHGPPGTSLCSPLHAIWWAAAVEASGSGPVSIIVRAGDTRCSHSSYLLQLVSSLTCQVPPATTNCHSGIGCSKSGEAGRGCDSPATVVSHVHRDCDDVPLASLARSLLDATSCASAAAADELPIVMRNLPTRRKRGVRRGKRERSVEDAGSGGGVRTLSSDDSAIFPPLKMPEQAWSVPVRTNSDTQLECLFVEVTRRCCVAASCMREFRALLVHWCGIGALPPVAESSHGGSGGFLGRYPAELRSDLPSGATGCVAPATRRVVFCVTDGVDDALSDVLLSWTRVPYSEHAALAPLFAICRNRSAAARPWWAGNPAADDDIRAQWMRVEECGELLSFGIQYFNADVSRSFCLFQTQAFERASDCMFFALSAPLAKVMQCSEDPALPLVHSYSLAPDVDIRRVDSDREEVFAAMCTSHPFVALLRTAPRRPEIVIQRCGVSFVGCVRPVVSERLTFSGGGGLSAAPSSALAAHAPSRCRAVLTPLQLAYVYAFLREFFERDVFHTAVNLLQAAEDDYLTAYVCLTTGYLRYDLSCTVRRHVRTHVTFSLALLLHSLETWLVTRAASPVVEPPSFPPWCDVLPQFLCNCTPRGHEKVRRTDDGRRTCRHMAQLIHWFLRYSVLSLGRLEDAESPRAAAGSPGTATGHHSPLDHTPGDIDDEVPIAIVHSRGLVAPATRSGSR